MKYSLEEHQSHDSIKDPKPDCEFCATEGYRRTHRCFGDGASSVPIEIKDDK